MARQFQRVGHAVKAGHLSFWRLRSLGTVVRELDLTRPSKESSPWTEFLLSEPFLVKN